MPPGTPPEPAAMPSNRKQLNVRLDGETDERIARLLVSVSAAYGIAVSQSDLVRLGMIELERKFPPAPEQKKGKK